MTLTLRSKGALKAFAFSVGAFLASTVLFQNCANHDVSDDNGQALNSLGGDNSGSGVSPGGKIEAVMSYTYGGSKANVFYAGEYMHGAVTGVSQNGAYACTDIVGTQERCQNLANYTKMPNAEWTYSNGAYRMSMILPNEWAGHTYKGYWYDSSTQKFSDPIIFEIRQSRAPSGGATCSWKQVVLEAVAGPCSEAPYACNAQVAADNSLKYATRTCHKTIQIQCTCE